MKPGNILLAGFPPPGGSLGQWHALVADFGVAHAASAAGDEAADRERHRRSAPPST